MMRAALYLRVSTEEQATENQRPELEAMARTRRLELVEVFEEHGSAAKRRPVFERLLEDAHRGRFDVLLVWAIDRLGRSMVGNLQDVLELDRIGVRVVSAREAWLDTTGPTRTLLLAVFSWIAEQERERLVERTLAGMDRARREGKRIGRPARMTPALLQRALRMREEGRSLRKVAMALGCPLATVAGAITRAERGAAGSPSATLEKQGGEDRRGVRSEDVPFANGASAPLEPRPGPELDPVDERSPPPAHFLHDPSKSSAQEAAERSKREVETVGRAQSERSIGAASSQRVRKGAR